MSCANLSAFVDLAEQDLLLRLSATGVGEVLPESTECSIESILNNVTGLTSEVYSCWYDPGISLSFVRFDISETVRGIQASMQYLETITIEQELKREPN